MLSINDFDLSKLTKGEINILNIIVDLYNSGNHFPSIRDMLKYSDYKSTSCIYRFTRKLLDKNILTLSNTHYSLNLDKSLIKEDAYDIIKIISLHLEDEYLEYLPKLEDLIDKLTK